MGEQRPRPTGERDTFAQIAEIVASNDALTAAKRLHEAGKHAYWKEKDLAGSVALLRAGAQVALTSEGADAESRYDLRSAGKAMCYDLASFTWSGWDEPGIVIAAADLAIGLDAARANLRLAGELAKGDVPLSRAHWMLGAQLMAARRREEAASEFELAADYGLRAGARTETIVAAGYAALAVLLHRPGDATAAARLETATAELRPHEDGAFFIEQIETAARVFRRDAGP